VISFIFLLFIFTRLIALLNLYSENLVFIRLFTALTSIKDAAANDIPVINIHKFQNVVAWSMIRRYLQLVQCEQAISKEFFLAVILLLDGILSLIIVVLAVLRNSLLANVVFSASVLYLIVPLSVIILFIIYVGVRINSHYSDHIPLLYKEQYKLKQKLHQFEAHAEENAKDIKEANEVVTLLKSLAEFLTFDNSSAFMIFGFQMNDSTLSSVFSLLVAGFVIGISNYFNIQL